MVCVDHIEVALFTTKTQSVSVGFVACASAKLPENCCNLYTALRLLKLTHFSVFPCTCFSLSAAQPQGLAHKRPSEVLL